MRVRLLAIVLALTLSAPIVALPRPAAAASAWCALDWILYAPTQGAGGSTITMTYTFYNSDPQNLNIYSFDVQYSWSGSTYNLGGPTIPGYGDWPFTQSITLPATPGGYSITATVFAQATGDPTADTCIFGPGPFTVTQGSSGGGGVTITPAATAGDIPFTDSFTASASSGTPPYTYSWSFGDGGTAIGSPVYHTFTAACSCLVQVTSVDAQGVQSTGSIVVTVATGPTVKASADRTQAAPGTNITFSASASGGTGGFTYAWGFGDGGTAAGHTVRYAYLTEGNYTATVTVTDSSGAQANASYAISIAALRVRVVVSATTVAPGAPITFEATPSGGSGGPYTVTWNFGNGGTATGLNATYEYNTAGTFTVKVTVKDGFGGTNTTALSPITVATSVGVSATVLYGSVGGAVLIGATAAAILLVRRRRNATLPAPPPAQPPTPPPQSPQPPRP